MRIRVGGDRGGGVGRDLGFCFEFPVTEGMWVRKDMVVMYNRFDGHMFGVGVGGGCMVVMKIFRLL